MSSYAHELPADFEHPSGSIVRVTYVRLAFVFGALMLFALQMLAGTSPVFAFLVLLFVLLSGATVSLLGGFTRLMGIMVAVLAAQHVVVSQVAKTALWEAADTPLLRPNETMLVYVIGMGALCVAALCVTRLGLQRIRPVFQPIVDQDKLHLLAITMIVLAFLQSAFLWTAGLGQIGGIAGPLRQISYISPLAVASSTAFYIVASGGKRCFGWLNFLAMALPISTGIVGAGRSTTMVALVTFVVTLFAFRFAFKLKHLAVGAILVWVLTEIVFPYALYARSYVRSGEASERAQTALTILWDFASGQAQEDDEGKKEAPLPWERRRLNYYGITSDTLGRFSVIITVDAVVDATIDQGPMGWQTIGHGFAMLTPRLFNPNKPVWGTANMIARRASGLVGDEDETTQITLGFFCDAFSSYLWWGAAIIPFVVGAVTFLTYRLLFDDRFLYNVIPIGLVYSMMWNFSEKTIQAIMLTTVQGSLTFLLTFGMILFFVNSIPRRTKIRESGTAAMAP